MSELTRTQKIERSRDIAKTIPAKVAMNNIIVHQVATAYVEGLVESKEAALVMMIEALSDANARITDAALNAAMNRSSFFVRI